MSIVESSTRCHRPDLRCWLRFQSSIASSRVERMAQREFRTFGQHVEILVGDDRRDLEDRVAVGIEAGHLQIDPDQVVFVQLMRLLVDVRLASPRPASAASLAGDTDLSGAARERYAAPSGNGRAMQTFLWHDYETFGADPRRDRPAQFARAPHDAGAGVVGEPVIVLLQAGARRAAAIPAPA